MVDGLVPVFEQDHSPDLNPEAVALALGDTLDQHFDGRFLVAHDLDPERLIDATFKLRPVAALKRKRYATSDIGLYERALPELIEALVPEAKQFGDFEIANAAEVLKRLRRLAELGDVTYAEARGAHAGVREVLAWLDRLTHAPDAEARAFEIDYVQHVENHLDDVQLVGITADPAARRQRLSKAYIPLSLSGETRTQGLGGPVYFENAPGCPDAGPQPAARDRRRGQRQDDPAALGRDPRGVHGVEAACARRRGSDFRPAALRRARRKIAHIDAFEEDDAQRIENAWWLRVPFLIPLRLGTAGRLPDLDELSESSRPTSRCRRRSAGSTRSCRPAAACC